MESGDPIGRLFDRLDEWRALPAYKLEPRVDVFFSFYLRDVLERVSGKEIDELVIPEFPLRHGVIFKDSTENRSKKVDFALFGSRKSSNELFLVELKTDAGSAGDEQFEYLKLARKQRPHDLVQGAFDLLEATASRYKNKYRTLLDRLEKIGWSMRDQKSGAKSDRQGLWVVRIVYVVPS